MKYILSRYKLLRYRAVSLVEMLITIVIITTVMLLVTVTLTTLIRTSAVTNARTTARQESEFIIELIRRNVRNSHSDDVKIYSVTGKTYNEESGVLVDGVEVRGYENVLQQGSVGNVIHFRPYGYHRWICIGYFPSSTNAENGYIVKSSYEHNDTPASCLDSTDPSYAQNAFVLNSSDVYVDEFGVSYYDSPSGNKLMTIYTTISSIYEMSFSKNVQPKYFKQALISTQKLTWE